jgi:hypothetical protein
MPTWLGYLLALAALLILAPLVAWLGRRHGRSVKGAAGLALMMLGFGQVFDPPKQHLAEAMELEEDGPAESGEPKVPGKPRGKSHG